MIEEPLSPLVVLLFLSLYLVTGWLVANRRRRE